MEDSLNPSVEAETAANVKTGRKKKKVVLVGSPNVGKSLLFNAITGAYVVVSNYPGTSVEVSRGHIRIGDTTWEVVDTPGMYDLNPTTEEERVARAILLQEDPDVVVHVIDAKNIERMLPLTLQLIEANLPLVLALNMMDEARSRGIEIDIDRLSARLGIPVAATVSTTGDGIDDLIKKITDGPARASVRQVTYATEIETAAANIASRIDLKTAMGPRSLALLLIQGDTEIEELVGTTAIGEKLGSDEEISRERAQTLRYHMAMRRQRIAAVLASAVRHVPESRPKTFADRLSAVMVNPWTGLPILMLVIYFGLYKFVGELGAGIAVDYLESRVFEQHINPFVETIATRFLPWTPIHDLVAGEYGVITLGLRYAIAIILPIVVFFFLIFSIMEDTGYLPRLALLIDRVFKQIGLSGRGVIPIVLGFGCDTMATMVTRTLPTVRERVIATMLLSLAIPCSAQLGVILALLHGHPAAFLVWAGVMTAVFLATGWLAARVLPGEPPHFYMELPPLRLPRVQNVFMKTYTRTHWYVKEVLPLFLLASVLIWLGRLTGLFDAALSILAYPVRWVGLPPETAKVFLFGFFRRDYGAAGLYDINQEGGLTVLQLTVATIALTLFLPCIAQLLMTIRERGLKMGLAMALFVLILSFVIAFIVSAGLGITGIMS